MGGEEKGEEGRWGKGKGEEGRGGPHTQHTHILFHGAAYGEKRGVKGMGWEGRGVLWSPKKSLK